MTVEVAEPQNVVFEEIDADLTPPCELGPRLVGTCDHPAKWVMFLVPHGCGERFRLSCDECKEIRLRNETGCTVCAVCGEVFFPARTAYQRIEAL